MPSKQRESTPDNDETASVDEAIDELRAHMRLIAARRAELSPGSFDPDLTGAAASVGKVLIAGAVERRQRVKAHRRELASYSIDDILAYLRGLPEQTRVQLIRDLSGADDNEPLL